MLRLADVWTWDFWLAHDGRAYHLYFLKAPRYIGHPDQRHWNASIGHATSPDLADWTVVCDAIKPSDGPAFDDIATWTGSVVRGRDGTWFVFYTGVGLGAGLSDEHRKAGMPGGTWCLPCDSPLGPFDVNRAVRITDESLYSGRLVRDRTGRWTMLAFRNHGPDGHFVGELTDPMPIGWATDGSALTLDVVAPTTDAIPGRSSLPHRTGGFPNGTDTSRSRGKGVHGRRQGRR
jgi:hypothetical protein